MLVQACNPSYLGDRNRTIVVQGHPGQKLAQTQAGGQEQWLNSTILATQEAEIRIIAVLKTSSQPIKAEHGGTCLSFQLHRRHKQDYHSPDQPRH
jgi:hypothetical protein